MEKSTENYLRHMFEKTERLKKQGIKKNDNFIKCKKTDKLKTDSSLQSFVTNLFKKEEIIQSII